MSRPIPGGVIFDLDETLVHGIDPDTARPLDLHFLSWRAVLAKSGFDLDYADFLSCMRGHTNDACLSYLVGRFGVSPDKRLYLRKERYYRTQALPRCLRWRDGAPELLASLNDYGVPIGILTNAPRENVAAADRRLRIGRYFGPDSIVTEAALSQVGLKPKPSPDGLLLFSRRYRSSPEHMVFIGDSQFDMQAAQAAGVAAVAVRTAEDDGHLESQGVDLMIDSFRELSVRNLSELASRVRAGG